MRAVRSLVDRLRRRTPPRRPVEQRVRDAIDSDSIPLLRVELGSPARAALVVSDGHPIFWIWLGTDLTDHWIQLLDRIAAAPAVRTELQWDRLLPASLSRFV